MPQSWLRPFVTSWLLCCLLMALIALPSFAQDEIQTSGQTAYDLDVTADLSRHTLSGEARVTYVNDGDASLEELYFWLMPNHRQVPNPHLDPLYIDRIYPSGFDPASLEVRAVTDAEGEPLDYGLQTGPAIFQTYSLAETLLRVELPETLASGARTTVAIHFTTQIPESYQGDESHVDGVYAWRFGWHPVAIPADQLQDGKYVADERDYYPYLLPTARYELTMTVPQDVSVAVGADRQRIIDETEGQKTIRATNDHAVRSMPVTFSRKFRTYTLPHPDVPISVYYLPGHEDAARLIASYAVESLDYFRERWGDYPHERLLIAETPSIKAGFSGATGDALVLINRQFFAEKDLAVKGFADRLLDFLIAHEIAHQWWGVGIGVDWNAENVLSEGLSQYFSITYFEDKYGEYGPNLFQFERPGLLEQAIESQLGYINLRQHLQADLPYLSAFKDRFDEAIVKPMRDVRFSQSTATRLYNKGYLMLRALEGHIGKTHMNELMRHSYQQGVGGAVRMDHFQALAESVSGEDLSEFFQEAFYRDTNDGELGRAPFADYSVDGLTVEPQPDGSYRNEITLGRRGSLKMPVQIQATTRAGGVQTATWELADQTDGPHAISMQTASPITEVVVDPDQMAPDVRRLNNVYERNGFPFTHRQVKLIATGENAQPLDAYLIRANPTQQVIEGGYLLDHQWMIGQNAVQVVKNMGRGETVGALAALLDGYGLIGQLSWTQTFYTQPETGRQGETWVPTDSVQLNLLRRPDSTGQPSQDEKLGATGENVTLFGVDWTHQQSVRDLVSWNASLWVNPSAFTRAEFSIGRRLRLAPNLHATEQLTLGWGSDDLGVFGFTLGELRSHADYDAYPYPGRIKAMGALALELPFRRDMEYNLLNVGMLHRVDHRLYARVGKTWTDASQIAQTALEDLQAEIGGELTLSGSTLGGLFNWSATVGLAFPISEVGKDSTAGMKQYIQVSTPFF